jgi:hypothetical protein
MNWASDMEEQKPQQVEVKPMETPQAISIPDLINAVTPLVQMHYETVKQGQDKCAQVQTLGFNNEEKVNKRNFIVIISVLAMLAGFSGGLMFYLKEVQAGILFLSHAAALGAGIIGGRGSIKHEVKFTGEK